MKPRLSKALMDDLARSVQAAVARSGLVNISELAEQVRLRNLAENVALEDIAAQVMAQAQLACAPMEFDSAPLREAGLYGSGTVPIEISVSHDAASPVFEGQGIDELAGLSNGREA